MRRSILSLTGAVVLFGTSSALAHTPYIAPSNFAPSRDYVVVTGSMSAEDAYIPDRPMQTGDFVATSPAGETASLGQGSAFKDRTILEVSLPQQGTWKISTGDRAGRVGKWAKIDGQWRPVRVAGQRGPGGPGGGGAPGDPGGGRPDGPPRPARDPNSGPIDEAAIPAGAEIVQSTNYLKAETYVSRGAPSAGALKPSGQGFELAPQTNPDEVFAGEPFKFVLLSDGKPAPGVEFHITRGGDNYADKHFAYSGKTDAAGVGVVTLDDPGAYLLDASYPARVEGGAPAARSTTYSLTFEATR